MKKKEPKTKPQRPPTRKKILAQLEERSRAEETATEPRKRACEICRTKIQAEFTTYFEGTEEEVCVLQTLCERCQHIASRRPVRLPYM